MAANLADQAAQRAGAAYSAIADWPELDDGWAVHAPVNELRANPFGLHHVHGNVWEWCLDSYEGLYYERVSLSDWDPVNDDPGAQYRVSRGGSFISSAVFARSAYRNINSPDSRYLHGVRPAKGISP